MNQQLLAVTQFNEVKQRLVKFAISDYAKMILAEREPLAAYNRVSRWLDETEEAVLLLDSGQHVPFMGLTRIQQLTKKIEMGLILEPGELLEYGDFLRSFRLIAKLFEKNQYQMPLLFSYTRDLGSFTEIGNEIDQAIHGNGVATDSSRQLRKIRGTIQKLEREIQQKLQKYIKNSSNNNYLQDKMYLMKDDRYTLPIRTEFKSKVKGNIVETSAKGTTVYIEPLDVSKLNDQLVMARAEEVAEVYQILSYLTGLIAEQMTTINYSKDVVIELDIIFARGKCSRALGGRKPMINVEDIVIFNQVKHPLLAGDAVPLSLQLGTDYRGLIITGPNAGGKTVVLKTVALTCLLTMFGLFVDNQPGTNIALFKDIFIDIGDQQSLENSLSTFSGHMANIAEILNGCQPHSLILLDEIGSGTEPNEGAALGIAIMEAMYQRGALLIATTHYGEIKDFALQHEDFLTAAMAFDAATLTPKYRLLLNEVGASNAFWIAKKMQIRPEILTRAAGYLTDKAYSREKRVFKTRKQTVPAQSSQPQVQYQQGDRVLAKDINKVGLYYEALEQNFVSVYIDGSFHKVLEKRLELQMKATELYPADYDVTTLFEDFATRKQRHDIDRGSKKAQKALDKAARARRSKNQ